jgi:hypothetical protein
MAGLSISHDFPLEELVGQELSQISIGRHHLRMSFIKLNAVVAKVPKYQDGANIDVEAGFRLLTASGQVVSADNSDLAAGTAGLTQLLEQTVASVQRLPNNELRLQFSDNSELALLVDPLGFESYHLHIDGESVDVTKEW